MASTIQIPDSYSLLGNLKSFILSSSSEVAFSLLKSGTVILSETYYPDNNNRIEIQVKDVISQYLRTSLPSSNSYSQTAFYGDFTATADGNSIASFRVVNAGVRALATSAAQFLAANWLTWQPQTKRTTWNAPEYLTYYFTVAGRVKAKFYLKSGTTKTVQVANVSSADQAYSFNMMMSRIFGLSGETVSDLYGIVDVWVENNSGTRLSYIQRYVCDECQGDEHYYLCVNSLGGIDTYIFHGACSLSPEINHESAEIGDVIINTTPDAERRWEQTTGYASLKETSWIFELVAAETQWAVMDGNAEPIVIDSSSLQVSDRDSLHSCTFAFKLSQGGRLMNISRTDSALPPIEVPAPSGEIFFLALRLSDYPDSDLSGNSLLLLQSPVSDSWFKASLGAISEMISQSVLAAVPTPSYRTLTLDHGIMDGENTRTFNGQMNVTARIPSQIKHLTDRNSIPYLGTPDSNGLVQLLDSGGHSIYPALQQGSLWGNSWNGGNVSGPLTFTAANQPSQTADLEVIIRNGVRYLHTRLPFYSDGSIAAGGIGTGSSGGSSGGTAVIWGDVSNYYRPLLVEGYDSESATLHTVALVGHKHSVADLTDYNPLALEYVTGSTLPTASASTMGKIYLLPNSGSAGNLKDEYITILNNGNYVWELIGNTAIDLTNYATKDWVQGRGYLTSASLSDYLPLSAGSSKPLTGSLYAQHILPNTTAAAGAYNLGDSTHPWKNIFLCNAAEIKAGNNTIMQIGDAGTYINANGSQILSAYVENDGTTLSPTLINRNGSVIRRNAYYYAAREHSFCVNNSTLADQTWDPVLMISADGAGASREVKLSADMFPLDNDRKLGRPGNFWNDCYVKYGNFSTQLLTADIYRYGNNTTLNVYVKDANNNHTQAFQFGNTQNNSYKPLSLSSTLTVTGASSFNDNITLASSKSFTLGDGVLTWDSHANAWKLQGNFYATGYIAAGGVGSGSGGSGGGSGDVSGIQMNGTVLTPNSDGVVDLGTVITSHQDISGKQNKVSAMGSTTKPVYVSSSGTFSACNTYAGGTAVTLNGTSKAASSASFYAPTTAGSSGQFLKSNGPGAPSWQTINYQEKLSATGNNGIPVFINSNRQAEVVNYLNIGTEIGSIILPFLSNDLAFLQSRGGTCTISGVTNTPELEAMFNGKPDYAFLTINSVSSSVVITIELPTDVVYNYGQRFYIDFGATNWAARSISVAYYQRLWGSNDPADDSYQGTLTKSDNDLQPFWVGGLFSLTEGYKLARLVITLTNFNTTTPRVSEIGIQRFDSQGMAAAYMSRGADDPIFRNITPATNELYNLGSTSDFWASSYIKYGNFSGNVKTPALVSYPESAGTIMVYTSSYTSTFAFNSTKNHSYKPLDVTGQLNATSLATEKIFCSDGTTDKIWLYTNVTIFGNTYIDGSLVPYDTTKTNYLGWSSNPWSAINLAAAGYIAAGGTQRINFAASGDVITLTGTTKVSGDVTVTGDVRLKGSGNYGNKLRFGDGDYCYLFEGGGPNNVEDDFLTIKANSGMKLTTPNGHVYVGAKILPTTTDTFDLGAPTYIWDDLYVKSIRPTANTDTGYPSLTYDTTNSRWVLTGNIYISGNMVASGAVVAGAPGSGTNNFPVTLGGSLTPNVNNSYSLGSSNYKFADVYAVNVNSTYLYGSELYVNCIGDDSGSEVGQAYIDDLYANSLSVDGNIYATTLNVSDIKVTNPPHVTTWSGLGSIMSSGSTSSGAITSIGGSADDILKIISGKITTINGGYKYNDTSTTLVFSILTVSCTKTSYGSGSIVVYDAYIYIDGPYKRRLRVYNSYASPTVYNYSLATSW